MSDPRDDVEREAISNSTPATSEPSPSASQPTEEAAAEVEGGEGQEQHPVAPPKAEQTYRLFLSKDIYLPVDSQGNYLGRAPEGRLGCVLLARNASDGSPWAALKIPRLTADTLREDAYICDLLDQERKVVETQHGRAHSHLVSLGAGETDLLKKPRATANSDHEEAARQRDHAILVRFEPQKPPRFCAAAKLADGTLSFYPPDMKQELSKFLDANRWDEVVTASSVTKNGRSIPFAETVFLDQRQLVPPAGDSISADVATNPNGPVAPQLKPLKQEMDPAKLPDGWFVGVPSVAFDWMPLTLEEAIAKRLLSKWTVDVHFELLARIAQGVCELHHPQQTQGDTSETNQNSPAGILHCDLRPANIMSSKYRRVDADGHLARDFVKDIRVGDYGSFADPSKNSTDTSASGNTQTGRSPLNNRGTRFYSPERRSGTPFESVDAAVIVYETNEATPRLLVRLGLAETLMPAAGGTSSKSPDLSGISSELIEWAKPTDAPSTEATSQGPHLLQRGDLLRIRDYMLTVKRAGELQNGDRVYECEALVGRILHERVTCIESEIPFEPGPQLLQIGEFTEFHQWSAATDVFSLGVLLLYGLHSTGLGKSQPTPATDGGDEAHTARTRAQVDHQLRLEFGEMMDFLESKAYLQVNWGGFAHSVNSLITIERNC